MSTSKAASKHYRPFQHAGIGSLLIVALLLVAASQALADGPRNDFAPGYNRNNDDVDGWRLGGRYESGGYEIYRRDRGGWRRVPGNGVQLSGSPDSPWLINSQYEIYRWNGWEWRRVHGSAQDIADGWVIGTDRRSGGFGIYRWNGYEFRRMPGAAIEIGGSYDHPWIVNSRGEQFEWTGRDWREVRTRDYGRHTDRDRGPGRRSDW